MGTLLTLIPFLSKIIFPLLDFWVKKNDKDGQMLESYYAFLKTVDKVGAAKVQNYLDSEAALKAKQQELQNQLDAQQGDN